MNTAQRELLENLHRLSDDGESYAAAECDSALVDYFAHMRSLIEEIRAADCLKE